MLIAWQYLDKKAAAVEALKITAACSTLLNTVMRIYMKLKPV